MQEQVLDAIYSRDRGEFYSTLGPEAGAAALVLQTAVPSSAQLDVYSSHGFLASLAQVEASDRPSWFNAMPTSVQDFWSSVGRDDIAIYTNDLKLVDPTALIDSSMAPSTRTITPVTTITEIVDAHSAATIAMQSGGAISSQSTSSNIAVAVTGVVLAAGLVGVAML